MVWCVSVVSEKRHEFHVLGVGGCRNVTKRRIPKNPLSRGKGGIIFSGYDDLKQRLGVAGILCYLRRFLKAQWGKNMFEVDPDWFLSTISKPSLSIYTQLFPILYDHRETCRVSWAQ